MSARDALIASVTGLVRRRGVAGTGLNALLEDSGVARRTVYLNFPGGKAELVAEATRLAGEALTAVIRSADNDGGDPAQAVQTFIDEWKAQLSATQMQAGCPIVAAILGRHSDGVTRIVQRVGPADEFDKRGKLAEGALIEVLAERRPPSGPGAIGLDTPVVVLIDQHIARLAEDGRSVTPRTALERLRPRRWRHRGDRQTGAPARGRSDTDRRDQDRRRPPHPFVAVIRRHGSRRPPPAPVRRPTANDFRAAERFATRKTSTPPGAPSATNSEFPTVTSHGFRKTVATLIDDAGLSARIGADHLGHAKVSMTQDRHMSRGRVHNQVADLLDRTVADLNDE